MANRVVFAKRRKVWRTLPGGRADLTASGTTSLIAGLGFTTAETILRIRGEVLVNFDPGAVPVADDTVQIVLALGLISSDAFAGGVFPDPADEPGYPWLYWSAHIMIATAASANNNPFAGSIRVPVDTKAMRKVKPNETLFWAFQYGDIAGTPPLTLGVGASRVLIALP